MHASSGQALLFHLLMQIINQDHAVYLAVIYLLFEVMWSQQHWWRDLCRFPLRPSFHS